MSEKIYLVYLHSLGFTHKDFFAIFQTHTNYRVFFDGLQYKQLKALNFSEKKIETILERFGKIDTQCIDKKIKRLDCEIVTTFDGEYPKSLKNTFHPPFFLYVRGKLENTGIAFVGSRKISDYGKQCIQKIVPAVGKYFSIISGGAYGCDTEAHKAALQHGQKTVVVFGTGIDVCYPTTNRNMFEKIVESGGTLVSIFPLGTPGSPYNFPIRNEIVAGLSSGVVVVEAQEKSGSLITANLALDLGKDLFAIPGSIFSQNSAGCNKLIQLGAAKSILSEVDILEEYDIKNQNPTQQITHVFSNDMQKTIYNTLLVGKKNLDELHEELGIDFQALTLEISLLELSGVIKKNLDSRFTVL